MKIPQVDFLRVECMLAIGAGLVFTNLVGLANRQIQEAHREAEEAYLRVNACEKEDNMVGETNLEPQG